MPTQDGLFSGLPDPRTSLDEGVREGRAGDLTNFYRSAGDLPIGATGLAQATVDALNRQHGTNFADPQAYYDYVYGPGGTVGSDADGNQFYKLPEGRTADQPVNKQLNYAAPRTWADTAFPLAFSALLAGGMGGMLPGTESIFGSAAGAGFGGDAFAGTGLEAFPAMDIGPGFGEALTAGAADYSGEGLTTLLQDSGATGVSDRAAVGAAEDMFNVAGSGATASDVGGAGILGR